ncbi:MAG: cytochrome c-type biogenesis protein CcmH [Alicyclobacillaceae bacterium]|nr:cytochrome c-type biogenesis protein CcmH [Alicyclobacillaceae bacterium]
MNGSRFDRFITRIAFSVALWTALFSLSLCTPSAMAQASVTWQDVLDIASEYHPPGCPPTLTGATCQERQAYDLRLEILKLLEQGKSRQEIRQILVSEYGDSILAAPSPTGVGIFVWAVPAAVLAIGVAVFILIVRGRRPPAGG